MALYLRCRIFTEIANSWSRKCISTSSSRSLNNRLRRIGSAPKEVNLKLKDNVPQDFSLIYRAPMEFYVSVAKNVSTFSAAVISILAIEHFANDRHFLPIDIETAGLVSEEKDIWLFAAGFVFISLAIRVFVARYPLRIYKNNDMYVAIFDSQLPLRNVSHKFKQTDVRPASWKSLNPWSESTFRLKNRTSVLIAEYFKTPAEFNQLIGAK